MKFERTKNATRNIIFGILLKIYRIIMPFLMRTAMIYFMGVQYLGLNSLFTSILQVLNLAELGVGSAMVYSMYKPIAENDNKKIDALMRLYRLYYRCIGLVIAVIGTIVLPFIPKLISGEVPDDINIYVLYLLNLAGAVFSYWLFAYKNSLLQAHQRSDVSSKIMFIIDTLKYFLQLLVLWVTKNYYLYVLVILGTQILVNISSAIVATYMYPNYKPRGVLDEKERREITCRIRDLFTAKLGAVIVNSVDTVVISAFLGLTVLAVYQNYYFILTSVIGIISTIFSSCTAGIGNSLLTETKEKNFNDLKKITFLIAWITGIGCCCFLNLYQPFMEIWVGKELMLEYSAVVCFTGYFFVYEINQLLNTYKDAGGIWHEDRFRPLVTALTNITLNLLLVQKFEIYGVLLSTVLSMLFVGMPWLLRNLFTTMFEKTQLKEYLKSLFIYVRTTLLACIISFFISNIFPVGVWMRLIIGFCVSVVISNLLFYISYHKMPEYKESLKLLDRMTKGKLHISKLYK